MAATKAKSAHSKAKPCPALAARYKAKITTRALPNTAHSQNPSRARWCSIQAATAAVARGSSAVKTAACPEVTWRSAKPSSSGKPMALPKSAKASGRRSCAVGQRERVSSKNTIDKHPAKAARPKVTNHGESWGASTVPVAKRVMGRVTAKMATPSKPSAKPRLSCWGDGFTAEASTAQRFGRAGGWCQTKAHRSALAARAWRFRCNPK